MNATGRQDSFNHLARKGFRPVTGNQATLDNDDIEAQKPGLAVEKSWRFTREMATADDKTLGHIAHQELKVRMGFLRKVVFLVLIQLSVTGGACVLAATVPAVAQFIQDTPALFYVCCGMVFVMIIVFLCIDGFRRRFPMNYICLFSFTVFESYLLAGVTAFLDSQLVIIALIMILSTVTMILTYAFQSKFHYTTLGGIVLASVGLFTAFGVINLLMPGNLGPSVIALIVGFIFSIFIVVDLQLVIGGRHYKYQLSVDEYCFAALNIYLDIVNMFIYIVVCAMNSGGGGGGE